MQRYELIEVINPGPGSVVRKFHCAICDRRHLQDGPIARVWVYMDDGYRTNASLECLENFTLEPIRAALPMTRERAEELIAPLLEGRAAGISPLWATRLVEALEYVIKSETRTEEENV